MFIPGPAPSWILPFQALILSHSRTGSAPSGLPVPLLVGSRGMKPPVHALGQGMGALTPVGAVRQVRTQKQLTDLHQNLPFSHPCLSPSGGEFRPDVCGVLPHSRLQSRAGDAPKPGAAFLCSLLWERDLAKGLCFGKCALATAGAEHSRW